MVRPEPADRASPALKQVSCTPSAEYVSVRRAPPAEPAIAASARAVSSRVVETLTPGQDAKLIAVTIVITTQRRAGPLGRAVRSALAQTGLEPARLELVVVDNDETPSAAHGRRGWRQTRALRSATYTRQRPAWLMRATPAWRWPGAKRLDRLPRRRRGESARRLARGPHERPGLV